MTDLIYRFFGPLFAQPSRMINRFLTLAFGLLLTSNAFASIEAYTPTMQSCETSRGARIVIRHFENNGKAQILTVEASTLKTQIIAASDVTHCGPVTSDFSDSAYGKLLKSSRTNDSARSNAGVVHSPTSQALFLTVDLCPSSHAYEKGFFDWVGAHKVPIALSISGGWINHHASELADLKRLPTEIVWVNHTLTHPYNRHLPDEHNFLLLPGVDVTNEVLGNEQKMIESGLTPSIYLRFPGLISNRAINDQVNSWGLVALGADGWLALGQHPKPGSIILVHGNGNEAPGIHMFMARASQFLSMGFDSLLHFAHE